MKIALVHDYIKEYGGAERVLEAMHDIWPQAPVYTTVYLPEFLGPHKKRFLDWNIIPSGLQNLPFVHKLISPIRLFTPWVFKQWDFSAFDAVIVSATGAYFPNLINHRPQTVHICYCHTPPRYLYGYPTARDWTKNIAMRVTASVANHFLRQTDFRSYQRPDVIIANSHEVQRRIEKFYRREATVIYPPVEIADHLDSKQYAVSSKQKKRYFITGGRLARAKHIDLIIKACNELQAPLKIFGRGFADYDRELHTIAGPTIEFVGEVNDQDLTGLYSGAKALLFASEFEDFGIMPVEAQACGTPVIAYKSGGVLETVIDGKTGLFFDRLDTESLITAIKKFDTLKIRADDCQKNAERFGKKRFQAELATFIKNNLKHK